MLTGAIIGAVVAVIFLLLTYLAKQSRFKKVLKSIPGPPPEYAGLFHYASSKRFKHSFKFFDSYGALYLVNKTVYYKTSEGVAPLAFNLPECKVQQEPDWRKLKWFSITAPSGEKYYFDSHKLGFFANDSSETIKALDWIRSKMVS
jgi:hypothetical protein